MIWQLTLVHVGATGNAPILHASTRLGKLDLCRMHAGASTEKCDALGIRRELCMGGVFYRNPEKDG